MNGVASVATFGVVTEPATLEMQRLLPGPIERVWAFLTESELRRRWLAAGEMVLEVGAEFELVWRNDELMAAPGERPPGMERDHSMTCRITAVDPPRLLAFSWNDSGGVSFELAPAGERVLLTLVHRRVASRNMLLSVGAGWHAHLDLLAARVAGAEPAPFWDEWRRLREAYDQRLPRG